MRLPVERCPPTSQTSLPGRCRYQGDVGCRVLSRASASGNRKDHADVGQNSRSEHRRCGPCRSRRARSRAWCGKAAALLGPQRDQGGAHHSSSSPARTGASLPSQAACATPASPTSASGVLAEHRAYCGDTSTECQPILGKAVSSMNSPEMYAVHIRRRVLFRNATANGRSHASSPLPAPASTKAGSLCFRDFPPWESGGFREVAQRNSQSADSMMARGGSAMSDLVWLSEA